VLHRLRGVIRITWGVIDKAGFNWLFIPHQSPLFPLNQSSLLLTTTMPSSCTANTYTVLFDPVHNGPGEFATAKESFNHQWFEKKRGSRVFPYPAFTDVYHRSSQCVIDGDTFEDCFWLILLRPIKSRRELELCLRLL
jgi:hypothetical protein